MNKLGFLQKYVDHKLNSIRCDMDDLSDYLENYTDDDYKLYLELLDNWKVKPEYFVDEFKPTETQIRQAIKSSKVLNILAERYKQAVIKCIPVDIIYNILQTEKRDIEDEIEYEQKYINADRAKSSALNKIKKCNLTKAEKKALGL